MMDSPISNVDASSPPLKIMVVDDTPANLKMMRSALELTGHRVITAASGEEALARFEPEQPDVVLMDVMMPGIGGIEATRRMRQMAGDRWLPILIISALSHSDDMVRGLEAGADDYLPKPVDLFLLLAKIRALQRVAVLQNTLRVVNAALESYRQTAEQDMALATTVMQCMIQSASMALEGVDLWLEPAAEMSGDLLVARRGDDGRIYVLLADAMGHGLPAALPVMPLIQVFSAMTREGCTVPSIAREMNAKLTDFLPSGHFVAVTLASIDRANGLIDIWNGGNPPVLLSNRDGQVTRRFAPRHPALGILSDEDFDATSEACQWDEAQCLTLYSDGLVEACDRQGHAFGETRLVAALAGESPYRQIKEALLRHRDGIAAGDDISLATLDLRRTNSPDLALLGPRLSDAP